MKKTNKTDKLNLFFSAFLVTAFIVCAHFFSQFVSTIPGIGGTVAVTLVYVVFGLLLFYATRVGDGKAVKRFSPVTLIVMVIPALYIILASFISGLPLHDTFADADGQSVIAILASIALGYGIPYTFLSGFEIQTEQQEEESTEETQEIPEEDLEGILETEESDEENSEELQTESAPETEENSEQEEIKEPLNKSR